MKSAPSETVETLHRVRQQLILAQVRIMELEDVRDGLTGAAANTDRLLAAAQRLADQKSDETAHLGKVCAELQSQFEYLRHMQHVTNEALNLTRSQLESTDLDRTNLRQSAVALNEQITGLRGQIANLDAQAVQLNHQISHLNLELTESKTTSATRAERINQLDAEIRAIKATRSWRWTAWLRSIERTFGGRKS